MAWVEENADWIIAGGVTDEGMKTLASKEISKGSNPEGSGLNDEQWLVCRFTDEMTKNVKVSDETFEQAKKAFGEKKVMELVSTVGAYNCVSRFLVALDGESS